MKNERKWWKEAVVYQIYPRSFKDSNGDGIGDLRGVIEKLDYIQSLGVDVVWLNPIFASPNDDNGYDISDYRAIMSEFGTMADFDEMLAGMHERGIKLVLDLVANHSSDEHDWFKQSRCSRDNSYRNYYHWWNAERGKPARRWSYFDENADAWKYDAQTDAYYLHYFSQKQPDLNWENPQVRQEIYDIMRFWFDKGVDGFRMDVVPFFSKDTNFPEIAAQTSGEFIAYYANGPRLHEYLQEMNREVLSRYDVMTVAEGPAVTTETVLQYVDEERRELNMAYHFEATDLGYKSHHERLLDPEGWKLADFKKVYSKWDAVFAERGWGTIYLGNHDQPRMTTRWGNDAPEFRAVSAKMLMTFLLTMRATPYFYFGDELGMTNIKFERVEDYQDIMIINLYKLFEKEGKDTRELLESHKISGRDNGRTPFQWDDSANAGFTSGTPWLKVNPNFADINAAAQENDFHSPLNYFRRLIKFRRENLILIYGKYQLVDEKNPQVYAYTRELEGKKYLILLNFSAQEALVQTEFGLSQAQVLFGNYPNPSVSEPLKPYEAMILELK